MDTAAIKLLSRLRRGRRIRDEDRLLRLPIPPHDTPWKSLGFDIRTSNALSNAGFEHAPSRLGDTTVEQALLLKGFGIKCLESYLETAQQWPDGQEENAQSLEQSDSKARDKNFLKVVDYLEHGIKLTPYQTTLRLPAPPEGSDIGSLGLDNRTRHSLVKAGFGCNLRALCQLTIGEALKVRGFGLHCLKVYLKASRRWPGRLVSAQAEHHESRQLELAQVLESVLQCEIISNRDPRFASMLRKLKFADSKELVYRLQGQSLESHRSIALVERFVADVQVACKLTIEQEAVAILGADVRARNQAVIRDYFGFGCGGPATLQSVADKFGITRERVRQICSRGSRKSSWERAFLPTFRRAKRLLESLRIRASRVVEGELHADGIIEAETSVGAILRYAQRLKMPLNVCEVVLGNVPVVLAGETRAFVLQACDEATKLIDRHGATSISRLSVELKLTGGECISASQIQRIVSLSSQFFSIPQYNEWILKTAAAGEIFSRRVRRVLSVASAITVHGLRQALRRDYRYGAFTPPADVMSVALQSISGVVVDGEFVRSTRPTKLASFGGSADERAIVELLQKCNGFSDRRQLQRVALASGISSASFWRCLSYSTLITRLAYGVYGLVGINLPPGVVADLKSQQKLAVGGVIDRGWTPTGMLWIAYRLSEASLESGVLGVPSALQNLLDGDFQFRSPTRENIGVLRIRESQAWGLKATLQAEGAEPGDCIVLEFDRPAKQMSLRIGDESIIDELAAESR